MIIENKAELLAIYRAIMEAKFPTDNRDLVVSSILNGVMSKLRIELGFDKVSKFDIGEYPEYLDILKRRVKEIDLTSFSRDQKSEIFESLLYPFTIREDLKEELIA